ncbi:MAG: YbaK/EbsC family protein [Phycisphaerales bacterium]|nr:YbaK/EbsC family protein [Phycisphaerales bacterium]
MPVQKLKQFLDENKVKYVTISHSPAFTAQQIAASAHVSGKDLAKTVMVKVDGHVAMAVLSATHQINFDRLKDAVGAKKVELAGEEEFKQLFPQCEVGAMPPFGNLYEMEVYMDRRLAEDEDIAFNAGSHTELIKMHCADYKHLVKPRVLEFSPH